MSSHNYSGSAVEHDSHAASRPRLSVMSTSHNISLGMLPRHITPSPVLGRGTGVLIPHLPEQRLRKPAVEPALRGGQPLDLGHAPPAGLGARLVLGEPKVEGAAVGEPQPGPATLHGGGVYSACPVCACPQDAPAGWYERGPTDDCPDPSCPCHDYAAMVTP